jgi:hypothetical protein
LPDLFLDLLEGRWPAATLARVGHHHAPAVPPHRQADENAAVRPEKQVRGVLTADPVEGDVGQQEVPRVRLPDEGQAEFVPHPAVRAVAADHVTGADLRLLAFGVADGGVDVVTALAEACQLASLLDRAAELVHARAQEVLGLGLGQIQDEPVPRAVTRHVQVEQAPVTGVHPVAAPAVAVLDEGLREPHSVQEFEGARVDRHCPALPGRTVALVDDAGFDPARQQLGR